jgi:hypothetical protein
MDLDGAIERILANDDQVGLQVRGIPEFARALELTIVADRTRRYGDGFSGSDGVETVDRSSCSRER